MNEEQVKAALEEIHAVDCEVLACEDKRVEAVENFLGSEGIKKLNQITEEYDTMCGALYKKKEALENEVKAYILCTQNTVKGSHLMAVWNKGRVSWDSKLLAGYSIAHPDILAAKKVGEPTVTFRVVK